MESSGDSEITVNKESSRVASVQSERNGSRLQNKDRREGVHHRAGPVLSEG